MEIIIYPYTLKVYTVITLLFFCAISESSELPHQGLKISELRACGRYILSSPEYIRPSSMYATFPIPCFIRSEIHFLMCIRII